VVEKIMLIAIHSVLVQCSDSILFNFGSHIFVCTLLFQ